MPTPESATSIDQLSGGPARTVTRPPVGVNLSALLSRLSTTWCSRVSSQISSGPSAHSQPKVEAGREGRRGPLGDRDREQLRQPGRHRLELQGAGLQPGQQQQVLDEPQQPVGVAVDHVEVGALVLGQLAGAGVAEQVREGDDRRQRAAQFVRDGGDELVVERGRLDQRPVASPPGRGCAPPARGGPRPWR